METAQILWRRLDTPGHDACRFYRSPAGWRVEGAAVFLHNGAPARLTYAVECGHSWQARHGSVEGWLGAEVLNLTFERTAGGFWALNGAAAPETKDCLDLDFGFTPATNLLPLRRLALGLGQAAEAPAAWLDLSSGGLRHLPQRYERRTESTYWYEAPSVGYSALLEVSQEGLVLRYPGLWEAEA